MLADKILGPFLPKEILIKLLQAAWLPEKLRRPLKKSSDICKDLITPDISHSHTMPSKGWGSTSTSARGGGFGAQPQTYSWIWDLRPKRILGGKDLINEPWAAGRAEEFIRLIEVSLVFISTEGPERFLISKAFVFPSYFFYIRCIKCLRVALK